MNYTHLKIFLGLSLLAIVSYSCAQEQKKADLKTEAQTNINMSNEKVSKTEAEWKKELSPEEYYVLREKGTERAFTSPLNDNKEKGIYFCAACGNPLFSSETKFKSGTGWPSFYAPIDDNNVDTEKDKSFGMVRTEVHCNRCGGHLGHIFNDGPEPTGLRYCINGVALDFDKKEDH